MNVETFTFPLHNISQYSKAKKHLEYEKAWRKCIRGFWKLNSNSQNDLLHHINNCLPIDILLEKRCIKFIYNIINSEHSLHSRIALYSLYNGDTTLGEHIIISCVSTKYHIKIGIVVV